MFPDLLAGKPHLGPEYLPYFYASGRFVSYPLPQENVQREVRYGPQARYNFTSDLFARRDYPKPQTVEDVIYRGYFAITKSDPENAIISDKKHTFQLGLNDVIGQIRNRHELYEKNIYELELAKCSVINSLYQHEAYHGPTDSRVEYSVNKRLDELYADQRDERVNLWRDISKLRLLLPENTQQYLNAYRKVSMLKDDKGDWP